MKLTATQLRQIIREEAVHALSGAAVDPKEINAMDEAGILNVVTGIGNNVVKLSLRRAQVSGFTAVGKGVESAAELASIVKQLDVQCRTLQVCVQALSTKSQTASSRAKYPQLKTGGV